MWKSMGTEVETGRLTDCLSVLGSATFKPAKSCGSCSQHHHGAHFGSSNIRTRRIWWCCGAAREPRHQSLGLYLRRFPCGAHTSEPTGQRRTGGGYVEKASRQYLFSTKMSGWKSSPKNTWAHIQSCTQSC